MHDLDTIIRLNAEPKRSAPVLTLDIPKGNPTMVMANLAQCESIGPDGVRCSLQNGHDGSHTSLVIDGEPIALPAHTLTQALGTILRAAMERAAQNRKQKKG